MNDIRLTKKDLKNLEDGQTIQVTIDGKPRVTVRHCDCEICEDYSKKFHEVI